MDEKRQNRRKRLSQVLSGLSTVAKIGIGVAVIVLLALLIKGIRKGSKSLFGRKTDISEVIVEDLRTTQKLKVLTVYREVLVNQFKESSQTFAHQDDQIAVIYPARLDYGFDFENWPVDSASELRGSPSVPPENFGRGYTNGTSASPVKSGIYVSGDTVYAYLPPITVLNKSGESLDESAKRTPIQRGFWTAAEKRDLARFAQAQMMLECEADGCYAQAEKLGIEAITGLLKSFGAKNVSVHIAPGNTPAGRISSERNNPYTIKRGGDRLFYFKYQNGATLMCTGDLSPYQMLSLANLLNGKSTGTLMQVTLRGSDCNIYYINERILKGSSEASRLLRGLSPNSREAELRDIQAIVGSDSVRSYEMDRKHNVLYTYSTLY